MHVEVKKNAQGIWYARPYLGRTPDGKPIQPYKQFPDAKDGLDALEMANAWAENLTAFGRVSSALIVDLLTDYVDIRESNGASPNSVKSYRLFTRYVAKFIGNKNARDLTVMDFIRFEQRLMLPKERKGQGLSRNSVRNVHDFLRGAYMFFVSSDICDRNPLLEVSKPSPEIHEAEFLDEYSLAVLDTELERLIDPENITEENYLAAMNAFAAWLASVTGMRVGETCAVRRCDVFKAAKYVHVGGTVVEETGKKPYRKNVTKGRKCRNVDITDDDLRVIYAFCAVQDALLGALSPQTPLVTRNGDYVRPTDVSDAFKLIAARLGLQKGFTFHGLRHTHATWLLTHGFNIKEVSERLGHADEATTLRLYAHVMPGRGAQAAQGYAQAVAKAKEVLQ